LAKGAASGKDKDCCSNQVSRLKVQAQGPV